MCFSNSSEMTHSFYGWLKTFPGGVPDILITGKLFIPWWLLKDKKEGEKESVSEEFIKSALDVLKDDWSRKSKSFMWLDASNTTEG